MNAPAPVPEKGEPGPARWMAAILIAAMLVALNAGVFFAGRTLIPITSAPGVVPGAPYGYSGPMPAGTTTLDPFASFCANYAYDAYTVKTLKKGMLPFWNPYQGLGQPLLSNGFSAVFYPPNWLRLLLPPAWWDMVYLVNWFLAALFLYGYLRLMGVRRGPALAGAAAVFSNGYVPAFLALREIMAVAAWWPLLLYGVERSVREPSWRARHAVLALGVCCSATGGQPEVAFLSLFSVLAYALMRVGIRPAGKGRALWALVPGGLAGLLLSAPAWVNFTAYAFTQFTQHTPEAEYGDIHLAFKTVVTYVFPYIYGRMLTYPYGWITGWIWDLSPGWFPAVGLFGALASVSLVKEKPRWGLCFLLAVAGIMAGKIFGVPGIGWLGRLPMFDRIFYPKFGGFLPVLALSGLTAYGWSALARRSARKWIPWLAGWWALAAAVFVVGYLSLREGLSDPALHPEAIKIFRTFGGLGFAWVLLGPAGLWWFKYRRPEDHGLLYSLAVCGMLLQGIATACHGYILPSYLSLGAACVGLYVLFAAVLGLFRRIPLSAPTVAAQFALMALVPLTLIPQFPYGPPTRYDPLTPAPYLRRLAALQQDNRYRSYSLDGTPQPDFACPFGIASLDVLDAAAPAGNADFMKNFLDRGACAIWFGGNLTAHRGMQGVTALEELHRHRRYFSLVGVRYLVTMHGDPSAVLYLRDGARAVEPLFAPLETTFDCPSDTLPEVEVYLSTYIRKNPGVVALSVWSPEGELLGRSEVLGVSVLNNRFQKFSFPKIRHVKGRRLKLRLEFLPDFPERMIAAWRVTDRPEGGFVFRVPDPEGRFPLVYKDESGVHIWENATANERVFLAPEAGLAASRQEALARMKDTERLTRRVWVETGPAVTPPAGEEAPAGELTAFRTGPNDVRFRYRADSPGILTVADSYMPGWRASLNGRSVPVLRVDGLFRGVRITEPGLYDVHQWFRPVYWYPTLAMAAGGALVLVLSSLTGRRAPRRETRPTGWGGVS